MKARIIYIAPTASSFVLSDIKGLEEFYYVVCLIGGWRNKYFLPFRIIQQGFQLLFLLPSAKAVIVSFGGYWSVLPSLMCKLLNIKCFIILNGTDSVALPQINYGSLRKKAIKKACEISYQNVTKLLPVSEALWYSENTFLQEGKVFKQGVHFNFPNLKTPYKVVHNGLDADFWLNLKTERIENSFVTVFSAGNETLKGVDLILKVAEGLPGCTFYFVGATKPNDQKKLDNVSYLGRQPAEELIHSFNKAQFYLQLSVFEGFGLALAEAMLCGCVPIVSNVNILPEISGVAENVLHNRDDEELRLLIKKAIKNYKTEDMDASRTRIVKKYSLKNRIETLKNLIEG